MKVIVSVFNNLCTDQRVEKICKTLYNNGYLPTLIGNNWGGLPEMERPYPFFRIELKSKKLRFAYIEFQRKLYKALLSRVDKDTIIYANDLETLVPSYLVAKKKNIPLVFDSHEIFTEMPSLQGRWVKKAWKLIEKNFVPKVDKMITASNSYSEWFVKEYAINKPIVVRNFPRQLFFDSYIENDKKIILYQGALNYSRGIDKAIQAMQYIDNAELWIAGGGPKEQFYRDMTHEAKVENKVQFLGNLRPDDLREITSKADVGISIEENNGLSYYYSLPNKISDYIQSRVPVVVSNFPEMQNIVNTYEVGEVIQNHDPKHLAEKLNLVLNKGKAHYLNRLNIAAQELCWEHEEDNILRVMTEVRKS